MIDGCFQKVTIHQEWGVCVPRQRDEATMLLSVKREITTP